MGAEGVRGREAPAPDAAHSPAPGGPASVTGAGGTSSGAVGSGGIGSEAMGSGAMGSEAMGLGVMRSRVVRSGAALRVDVPAKVNLALHVTGQRADGYHLLDSLVAFTETAFDAVTVTFGEADEVAFSASGPFAADVPAENSVVAAARAVGGICAVALEKGLPVASGLGGGSADAAAVLRAAVTVGRLAEADALALAARLGADVPVCFAGRACRMGGIGEVLAPLSVPRVPAVIANPLVPVSTAAVFARLAHKENNAMDVRRLSSVDAVAAFLGETRNDLMAPAMAEAPIIADVLEALREAPSCLGARMSGSGASVFGLFADDDAAARAAAALAGRGWWVKATAFAGAL